MTQQHTCQVLIVGGGPVGLVMASLLARQGVDVVVLERRTHPRQYSRAIGLHPPALAVLNAVQLEEAAVAEGRRVHSGAAYSRGRRLGGLSFEQAWPDRPFVLTLPQNRTEALLSQRLTDLAPGALHPGWEVLEVRAPARTDRPGAKVQVRARSTTEQGQSVERTWSADLVIGADGPRSLVRRTAGIGLHTQPLHDTYIMGDFAQHHSRVVPRHDDAAAAIFLAPTGVVESFPLPGNMRRWVAHTGTEFLPETPETLTRLIAERTGEQVDPSTSTMMSAFAVRRRLAHRMATGRCVIIGDAAHEVSPIGGQGMTLGWLDAWHLTPLIIQMLAEHNPAPLQHIESVQRFEHQRLLAARAVARQAELNMALGRPMRPSTVTVRDVVLRSVLATGLRHRLAKAFSMRQPLGGPATQIPR